MNETGIEQLLKQAQLHLSAEDAEELSRMLDRIQSGIEALRLVGLQDTEPQAFFQPK